MTKKLPILGSIVALMTKVLGHTFLAASWKAWRTLLRGAFEGLQALDDGGRELIFKLTGRRRMPASLRELWVICGRRAGKSIIAAVLAICATTCRKYTLAPGEVGTCAIVAVDRKQARVIKRYISGLMRSVPRDGEERRLLAAANPWMQRLIIAAIETGCRRGELLKLQWRHVDLTRGHIKLPAELTKTAEGRTVVISARLRPVLELIRTSPLTEKDHEPMAYVFGNAAGERVDSPKKAWEVCVLKAHGYKPEWKAGKLTAASREKLAMINLHFHDLRHEAGSRWIEQGWPIHHVQQMLGTQT